MSHQIPNVPDHLKQVVRQIALRSYTFFGALCLLFAGFMITSINKVMFLMWFVSPVLIGIMLYCLVQNILTIKRHPEVKPFLPKIEPLEPNSKFSQDIRRTEFINQSQRNNGYMGTEGPNAGLPIYRL